MMLSRPTFHIPDDFKDDLGISLLDEIIDGVKRALEPVGFIQVYGEWFEAKITSRVNNDGSITYTKEAVWPLRTALRLPEEEEDA